MENTNNTKLVEVFAGQLWEATMIQNILEDNQIQTSLENTLMSTIEPWAVSAGGVNAVKVIVSDQDYDQSMKLIEEYNNSEQVDGTEE